MDLALEKEVDVIAFTYNEPTIHYDYIAQVGAENDRQGKPIDIVIKTNGFADRWVIDVLASVSSAINIDIKGDEAEYQRICGGSLSPVLTSVENLVGNCHIEISYLVLPRMIADFEYHRTIRDWLFSLDPNIPVHMLYFFPFYRMKEPRYDVSDLIRVAEFFQERMNYVYVSNIFEKEALGLRNTFCPSCGVIMVARQRETVVHKNACCGHSI